MGRWPRNAHGIISGQIQRFSLHETGGSLRLPKSSLLIAGSGPITHYTEAGLRVKLDERRAMLILAAGIILPDGVAFSSEGKLVRKAIGYEQEEIEAAPSPPGSRAARAELPAPIGAYR